MTEQSQNICKKVPLELLLHRLQLGFDEFHQVSLIWGTLHFVYCFEMNKNVRGVFGGKTEI